MSKAFPIKSKNRLGQFTGGTGFLATYKDRLWLITALHVVLADNDRHCRWDEWPDEIGVRVGPGITVNIFDDQRRPMFAYKAEGEAVADIIALDWSPLGEHTILADAPRFDLTARGNVEVGDPITALGYPTDIDEWPQPEVVARDFDVVGISRGLVEHRPDAGSGMSGGPVLDRRGGLVGLVIGHNYGIGRVADVEAIRWIIDDALPNLPLRP